MSARADQDEQDEQDVRAGAGAGPDLELVGYGAWGEAFFVSVVTVERVLSGVAVMRGRTIDVGPVGVGPGRMAKARARGVVGEPTGRRVCDKPARFDVDLPVSLELEIDLGVDTHRFTAEVVVPLHLTALARRDLTIVLDVRTPEPHDLGVRLRACSRRAALVQHAAHVESELRRFVARHVAAEIDAPHVLAARVIDVAAAVDGTFAAIEAARPAPPPVVGTRGVPTSADSAGATPGAPPPGPVVVDAVAAEPRA